MLHNLSDNLTTWDRLELSFQVDPVCFEAFRLAQIKILTNNIDSEFDGIILTLYKMTEFIQSNLFVEFDKMKQKRYLELYFDTLYFAKILAYLLE